jgi:hypothetical protein
MQHESEKNPSASDLRWKLRLFASADLVGSTAYKASQATNKTPDWASTFREFFRDFPLFLDGQYSQLPEKFIVPKERLEPWKFLGDEILFVVELKCCLEALSHIHVLRSAVTNFPSYQWIKDKSPPIPLRLKAVAWLAGFPVTNTEIILRETIDYIGPAIDLGFRIAKFSEPRKLILSADLALLILDALHDLEISSNDFRLGFSSRETLKGVISNEPYPILWLGIPDDTFFLEEELLRTPCDPGKLINYLRKYIDGTPKLMRPFIHEDPHPKYCEIPVELAQIRDNMKSEESYRGLEKTMTQDAPPISGPVKTLTPPEVSAEKPS